jgi:predicted enzyme involved in methoxymalonyl-ACP biosynthesis
VHNIYRGVIYSQIKLKQPSEEYAKSGTVYLSEPTGSSKKFLLLDLDETLIHA